MRRRWHCIASICLIAFTGCAVTGVHNDQANLRIAMVNLCSNQVMDNLVRASNGLPIIHLDYTNGNTQVTMDVNASVGETGVNTRTNTLAALTMSSALVVRTFANTIAGSLGLAHTNQVGVTATPVTTNNHLYDEYLSFLTIPGSLVVTDCAPPEGAAHVCQKFHDQFYWVPVEFRDQYFELAAITTAQRGKSLLPMDPFFTVTLDFADPGEANKSKGSRIVVQADKAVPIQGNGRAELDGKLFQITEATSDHSRIDFVSKKFNLQLEPGISPRSLNLPAKARLFLREMPPPPTTKDLLEKIPFRTPQVSLTVPTTTKVSSTGTATEQAFVSPDAYSELPQPE